jgi:hypothetical protein
MRTGISLAAILALALPAMAQTSPALRDTAPDTWMATDDLGRSVSTHAATGNPRPDKFVGVFYFIWHDPAEKSGPWDIARILKRDPTARDNTASPLWGPWKSQHHWGEPLFGYYLNDDAWVVRKHAQMLSDAMIDVIIFDVTNHWTYPTDYMALLKTFDQMRREGNRTPQVAFMCNFSDPGATAAKLHEELYSKKLYPDLWFQWDGKPLILAEREWVDPKIRDFFTFRAPQADMFVGPARPNMWGWLEVFPQHMFTNARGEKEEMCVGVAQNAVDGHPTAFSASGTRGRSYHDGKTDVRSNAVAYGLNLAEQFDLAIKQDPKFIFVTGWNEWLVGRLPAFLDFAKGNVFVDTFDQEHSRDIEPMKGGHGDDYYYQLVDSVRRFKGARAPAKASPPKTIDIAGDFAQWAEVGPEYLDDVYDTTHRDHRGFNTVTHYVNTTGRNDIISSKVACDDAYIYFYIRTREPLTPHTDPNWMNLLLDVDCDAGTGWHGYDVLINHQILSDSRSMILATKRGWNWTPVAEARFRYAKNELMLAIPRSVLSLPKDKPVRFAFKWADNVADDNILAFMMDGDVAPNGRFNYCFHQSD